MRMTWLKLIFASVPLVALAAGCVARIETDPAPSSSKIEVVPEKSVDVDVNVKRP